MIRQPAPSLRIRREASVITGLLTPSPIVEAQVFELCDNEFLRLSVDGVHIGKYNE
jgi:hypothetical protein